MKRRGDGEEGEERRGGKGRARQFLAKMIVYYSSDDMEMVIVHAV